LYISREVNEFRPGAYVRNPMSYEPSAPSTRFEEYRYGFNTSHVGSASAPDGVASSPRFPLLVP